MEAELTDLEAQVCQDGPTIALHLTVPRGQGLDLEGAGGSGITTAMALAPSPVAMTAGRRGTVTLDSICLLSVAG